MGQPLVSTAPPDQSGAAAHAAFPRIIHRGRLLAVRARYADRDFGSSGPYVADTFGRVPSYLCALQLRDFPGAETWADERHFRLPRLTAGAVHIYDLRHEWRTDTRDPFDNVHLNIPQDRLDDVADEFGLRPVDLDVPAGFQPAPDDTLHHLGRSLLPALARPNEMNALFADHVITCAAIHLAESFGGLATGTTRFRGGLSPSQQRCARELLMESLRSDIGLKAVADACGLSTGHFIKAFRQSFGLPPHRWLLRERVRCACDMLLNTDERLDAIALHCGFADQSHMTRVFSKTIGVPPGTWRQQRRA